MTDHITVLRKETIDALDPKNGEIYVDGTLGGGGHTEEILLRAPSAHVIGLDLDPLSLERAHSRLAKYSNSITYVQGNFRALSEHLVSIDILKVHGCLLDLGYNSFQLEDAGRGISFKEDEPLLMTLAGTAHSGETALELINTASSDALTEIIKVYGEERFARKIAEGIVHARAKNHITTTGELVSVILQSVPNGYRHGRIHPATRTFQALRIAVNDELGALSEFLTIAPSCIERGGRLAIISFHSLEDRIVKHAFKQYAGSGKAVILTKKPITPSEEEIRSNPRSRSAKLRVCEFL